MVLAPTRVGYVDYFPQATAALVDYDRQQGGAAYAAARQKQRVVQNLAAQASAGSGGSGYVDLYDGGYAIDYATLDMRRAGIDAYFAEHPDSPDRASAYAALSENERLIGEWNATADREVEAILSAGLGTPMRMAAEAAFEPVNIVSTGYQYGTGQIGAAEAVLSAVPAGRVLGQAAAGVRGGGEESWR